MERKQAEQTVACAVCCEDFIPADGATVCPSCRKKMARYDHDTVQDMMEEVDFQLQKYLSDDLRNAVYNELATRFYLERPEEVGA